ncbi:hypothetical protein AB0F81_06285 [Actinoplanes sp. NPDC024001]|uniref:hypothetical protein n=1 Tax=Actinoplanes sp. NPDC024001 TaxID=3154598 RepID=UPI0033F720E7
MPEGVPAQLDLFLGGGSRCAGMGDDGPPRIRVRPVVEIPTAPILCFGGFDGSRDLTVTVTTSTGTRSTFTIKAYWDSLSEIEYLLPPGSPTGRYQVHAAQGRTTVSTTFEVRRASVPTLWLKNLITQGETIHVYLGGFAPGQPVGLHLYACPQLQYRTTMTVSIDHNGEGRLDLRTNTATEPTCYAMNNALIYTPPEIPNAWPEPDNSVFWLHRPTPPTSPPPPCLTRASRC